MKLAKPERFVGRAALERVAADGPRRRLVGLSVRGRGIARHGYPVYADEQADRVVTSGDASPDARRARSRWPTSPRPMPSRVRWSTVGIRDARVPAEVVPLPFYRRPRLTALRAPHAERTAGAGRPPYEEDGPPMVPTDLRYTKDHEWVRVDGDEATVGITEYAAEPARRHRLRRAARRSAGA